MIDILENNKPEKPGLEDMCEYKKENNKDLRKENEKCEKCNGYDTKCSEYIIFP